MERWRELVVLEQQPTAQCCPSPQAAIALTALVGAVGADASGALAAEVHGLGLPAAILADLASSPPSLFAEVPELLAPLC